MQRAHHRSRIAVRTNGRCIVERQVRSSRRMLQRRTENAMRPYAGSRPQRGAEFLSLATDLNAAEATYCNHFCSAFYSSSRTVAPAFRPVNAAIDESARSGRLPVISTVSNAGAFRYARSATAAVVAAARAGEGAAMARTEERTSAAAAFAFCHAGGTGATVVSTADPR